MVKKDFKLGVIYFYITGGCNLRCRHCWITPDSTEGDMDTESIKEMIRQAKKMDVKNIKITGGEPFLRKDIFEILYFIKDNGIAMTMETNGTFIGDKEARELKKIGLSHISVSIDSFDPGFHDDFRGVKGSFSMAVNGVKALRKAGFRPQVIASIYRENVKDIKETALFAQSIGAESLKLNPITCVGRGENMHEDNELLSVEEILELESYIDKEVQPGINIPILLDIPLAFKKMSYIKKHKGTCGILNMIGMLSDGTISMCGIGKETPALNMGNIKKDRLEEVWRNNPVLLSIREGIPDKLEGVCSECIFKRLCLGKCRADAYHRAQSLTAPFHFCQEAFDRGLFPKTRMFAGNKKKMSVV